MSNKDIRFKRLFNSMRDSGEIKLLESLIACLVGKTYQVSEAELRSIFESY